MLALFSWRIFFIELATLTLGLWTNVWKTSTQLLCKTELLLLYICWLYLVSVKYCTEDNLIYRQVIYFTDLELDDLDDFDLNYLDFEPGNLGPQDSEGGSVEV